MAKWIKVESKKLISPAGRLSFPNLFTPRERNGKKSWDCVVVWPEGTDLSEIKDELTRIAELKFGPGALKRRNFKNPLKTWEEYSDDGLKYGYPEGSTWASFSNKVPPPPVVFDAMSNRKVFDDDDGSIVYSGCWVQVKFDMYAYDVESIGVSFGLISVCKRADDNRFAGRHVNEAQEAADFGLDPSQFELADDAFVPF